MTIYLKSKSTEQSIKNAIIKLLEYSEQITKYDPFPYADSGDFVALKTKFLFLLRYLSPLCNAQLDSMQSEVESLHPVNGGDFEAFADFGDPYTGLTTLVAFINSLKFAHEAGILGSLVDQIAKSISDDFLEQAKQLLDGNFCLPSAVLIGAVLEDAFRRLCQRHNPPIQITKPNGEPKTLNVYIDELKKEGVFNELKAKQLRSWADIRNAAAHGEPEKFDCQDVEQMLIGVQNFLADYL